MLEKLLENLLKSLENGNWFIAVTVISIAAVWNLKAILEFFQWHRKKHEDFIRDYLAVDVITDAAKSALVEQVNHIVYKRITGIAADRPLREKIHYLVEKSNGELQTSEFYKARRFIKIRDGKLSLKVESLDIAENWFNKIASAFCTFFAIFLCFLPATLPKASAPQIAVFFALAAVVFFFGLFLIAQTIPINVAERIDPIIQRLESERLIENDVSED